MKIIKNTLLILIFPFLFNITTFSKTKDTIYFDKNWNKTNRKNHQFYRLLPLKTVGELSLIIDYYKNGKMQMQGYAYSNNLKNYVGDVYWYYESGTDTYNTFNTSKINTKLKYYHHNGSLWKEVPYKNGLKDGTYKIYDYKNKFRYANVYKKGKVINNVIDYFGKNSCPSNTAYTYTLQWIDSPKTAKKVHYSKNRIILKEENYSQNGSLLKSYQEFDFADNQLKNGTCYEEKTENGFVVDFDTLTRKNFQSKIINLNNIHYINKENKNFISVDHNNNFKTITCDLYHNKNIPRKSCSVYLSESDKDKIQESDLISVKKIKKQSVDKLLKSISKKQWEAVFKKKKYYANDSINHKVIFKQYNESLFINLELKYAKSRDYNSDLFHSKKDYKKKWILNNLSFYTINVILLNGNQPILALSSKNVFKYFIIPLDDGSYYVSHQEIDMALKNKSPLSEDIILELTKLAKTKKFYSCLTKNKKKYIANEFHEVLINKPYDSIRRIGQFIIAKNSKNIDIYNFKLEKLRLKDIRVAYFDRTNLQVLCKNKVFFINSLGAKTKRQDSHYALCGTVISTYFSILDTIKEQPRIKIGFGMMNYKKNNLQKIILLTNLKNKQNITFLNKTKYDYYNHNSPFIYDHYSNRTQTLLVKDNNKFGLYSYSEDSLKTKAKELLPIEYDNIELKEPFIILKKDNKFGIYKDKKGLIYKSLGSVNVNFMKYEKLNGEKGWIDIRTFKNYPNK